MGRVFRGGCGWPLNPGGNCKNCPTCNRKWVPPKHEQKSFKGIDESRYLGGKGRITKSPQDQHNALILCRLSEPNPTKYLLQAHHPSQTNPSSTPRPLHAAHGYVHQPKAPDFALWTSSRLQHVAWSWLSFTIGPIEMIVIFTLGDGISGSLHAVCTYIYIYTLYVQTQAD